MKRKKNSPRQMWSEEEDRALVQTVRANHNLSWKQIASKLRDTNPEMRKSGKQCCERYRNYILGQATGEPWTDQEHVLFVVLHSAYGNRWSRIASFFPHRNDLSIKNFFYLYVRKVLRAVKSGRSIDSTSRRPWDVFGFLHILDLVRRLYLPRLLGQAESNLSATQALTILNAVKKRKVDEKILVRFKKKLISKFLKENKASKPPIIIWLNPENFYWSDSKRSTVDLILRRRESDGLSHLISVHLTTPPPVQLLDRFASPYLRQGYFPALASPGPSLFPSALLLDPQAPVAFPVPQICCNREESEGLGRAMSLVPKYPSAWHSPIGAPILSADPSNVVQSPAGPLYPFYTSNSSCVAQIGVQGPQKKEKRRDKWAGKAIGHSEIWAVNQINAPIKERQKALEMPARTEVKEGIS